MLRTILLAFAMAFFACNDANTDQTAESENLKQVSREWARAAESGDVEKTLQYWSDDAMVISAGEPVRQGKASIREMVEGSMNMPGFKITWEPEKAVIAKSGDLGYLIENTTMSMPDSAGNAMTHRFKTVTIWKKDSAGNWKNTVDAMIPAPSN